MMEHIIKATVALSVLLFIACYSNPDRRGGEEMQQKTVEMDTSIFPEKQIAESTPPVPPVQEKSEMIFSEQPVSEEAESMEQIVIEKPEIPGLEFTDAVIGVMKAELESFGGWRPNDIVFGHIWHNRKYEQLGKLEVIRHTVRIFKQDIARSGGMDKFDPNMVIAEAEFWNDPMKFWFPSAESKYKTGVEFLEKYRDGLARGQSKFYPRSDNLYRLMDQYIAILGDVHHQLMLRNVSYFEIDNIFFYSRGAASAMAEILSAVEVDFGEEIERRGLMKLMRETIEPLKEAASLKPIIVLSGGSDDIRANHRLNLAAYISEARTKLYAMIETLQK